MTNLSAAWGWALHFRWNVNVWWVTGGLGYSNVLCLRVLLLDVEEGNEVELREDPKAQASVKRPLVKGLFLNYAFSYFSLMQKPLKTQKRRVSMSRYQFSL